MCKHDLGKPHGPRKTKAVNAEDQPQPFSCSEYLQINDPRYSLVPDTCCVLCVNVSSLLLGFLRITSKESVLHWQGNKGCYNNK